jgi:predicted nucleotidyltransferase
MAQGPTPVETVDEIRERIIALVNDPVCKPVCWVGVFGSFSRSTQTAESDVDLIVGYESGDNVGEVFHAVARVGQRAPEILGRPIDVIHMTTTHPGTYLLLEALLTSVTVYGSEEWPSKSKDDARKYLDEGYRKLSEAYRLLCGIQEEVNKTPKEVPA